GLFPPPPIGGFRVGFNRPRVRNFGELRCVHVPCLLEKVLFSAFGIGQFLALLIGLRDPLSNYLRVVGADRALRECPPRGGQVVLEGFGQTHRFARGSPGRARLRSDPRVEVALPVECPLPARLGSGENVRLNRGGRAHDLFQLPNDISSRATDRRTPVLCSERPASARYRAQLLKLATWAVGTLSIPRRWGSGAGRRCHCCSLRRLIHPS